MRASGPLVCYCYSILVVYFYVTFWFEQFLHIMVYNINFQFIYSHWLVFIAIGLYSMSWMLCSVFYVFICVIDP